MNTVRNKAKLLFQEAFGVEGRKASLHLGSGEAVDVRLKGLKIHLTVPGLRDKIRNTEGQGGVDSGSV